MFHYFQIKSNKKSKPSCCAAVTLPKPITKDGGSDRPVAKLKPDLDLNSVKTKMGNFPKLSVNDDLKIDWDDKYLVVFYFMRRVGAYSGSRSSHLR